jgi:predicted ATPase
MDFPDITSGLPREDGIEEPAEVDQYGAIQLFLQAARRAQPGFDLTTENRNGVVRICRLVEGMPLAILLAAAWLEMLAPAEIAAEIGKGLDFLESDLHDVPARQRSVRAVFDHSWHLLPERERKVFQALSVFRGGFTRHAAKQVVGGSLRGLRSLVNKSPRTTPSIWGSRLGI